MAAKKEWIFNLRKKDEENFMDINDEFTKMALLANSNEKNESYPAASRSTIAETFASVSKASISRDPFAGLLSSSTSNGLRHRRGIRRRSNSPPHLTAITNESAKNDEFFERRKCTSVAAPTLAPTLAPLEQDIIIFGRFKCYSNYF
uniref:Uncharacterized protein n=1 Tax=Panagrolaimus superbus TaxID=310955 RepID=A0A914YLB1_9BILA